MLIYFKANENGQSETRQPSKIPRLLDGKYFSIESRNRLDIVAKCMQCGRTRKGSIKSTGNFMDHYRSFHPQLIPEIETYKKVKDDGNPKIPSTQTTLKTMFSPLTTKVVSFHLK